MLKKSQAPTFIIQKFTLFKTVTFSNLDNHKLQLLFTKKKKKAAIATTTETTTLSDFFYFHLEKGSELQPQ